MPKTIGKTSGASPPDSRRNLPDFTRERCKQCGICAHFCPKGALTLDPQGNPLLTDPDICNACRLCEYLCPDFGVKVRPEKSGTEVPPSG